MEANISRRSENLRNRQRHRRVSKVEEIEAQMGPECTEVSMRSITKLPHFKSRYTVPASRGYYFTDYVAACIATRIGSFLESACNALLGASLKHLTLVMTMLAMCSVAPAVTYAAGRPAVPATSVQGSSSMKTVIDVRTSPPVYLPGPAIRVEVYSTNPVTPEVRARFQEGIEQVLLMNDPRLSVTQTAPDTAIDCTITDLTISPRIETRTRPEYRRTGQVVVTDSDTGYSRTEDQFAYVDVPYRVLVFEGRIGVKWEVTDIATGIRLYSDTVYADYSNAREAAPDFGTGPIVSSSVAPMDLNIAYLKLADRAAGLVLAQLSPGVHSEIVALSSGKLKDASTLLASGRWSEALTLLSSMPAFKEPKDDAYRFYSTAVAQEAIAYESQDPLEKMRQLEQSVNNYRRAAELKPGENMFWAPKDRAESALAQTSAAVAQLGALEEAKKRRIDATGPKPNAGVRADLFRQTNIRVPAPVVIDNQTVVQWVKAGRSTDYIIASIKHASGTRFDLSQVEVLKLRRDGVSASVLKAMANAQANARDRPRAGVLGKVLTTALSLLWLVPFVVR